MVKQIQSIKTTPIRNLEDIINNFETNKYQYSSQLKERLNIAYNKNYSEIQIPVTISNDSNLNLLTEKLQNSMKEGTATIAISNTKILHAIAFTESNAKIIIVDLTEKNIDGLKFLLNEATHYSHVEDWKRGLNLYARGHFQNGSLAASRHLQEDLRWINQAQFQNIQKTIQQNRITFIIGDLKNKNTANQIFEVLGPQDKVGTINISNVPQYVFPPKESGNPGAYHTTTTPDNSPKIFMETMQALAERGADFFGGMSINRVGPITIQDLQRWYRETSGFESSDFVKSH